MARTFNGSGNKISCTQGATNIAAPMTVAAIVKRSSDGTTDDWWTAGNSNWAVTIRSTNKLSYVGPTQVDAPTITPVAADNWQLVAINKATGAANPRFHQYKYSSNAWVHENGASTSADPTAGSGACNIGGGTGNFGGDIAIVGVWNVELSDAQVEALAFTLPQWFQTPPKALWLLDQDPTTQKVIDLTGNGSNESALTGTTVSTNSVPLFSYGGRSTKALIQPAAGGGGASGPRDLLLMGAG